MQQNWLQNSNTCYDQKKTAIRATPRHKNGMSNKKRFLDTPHMVLNTFKEIKKKDKVTYRCDKQIM